MRKPQPGFHSFERLFADIRSALPEEIQVRVVYCPFPTKGFFPRFFNFIYAFFIQADVVHVTGGIDYLTTALIGRRSVLTIHDLAPLRPKSGWVRWVFRYLWYVWPLRTATIVTAISKSVQAELKEELGTLANRVIVIPNCISSEFRYVPKAWPSVPIVLMVGTRAQKNVERMSAALEGLQVKVHIIGELSDAQRQLFQQKKVSFRELGRISDTEVLQAYRDCDMLAFASTYEGFGLPILEAQATGRPVLTSQTNVLREVAGEGACFVDHEQIASIRAGFERILNDPDYRKHLVETGENNAKRYSAESTAKLYTEVYQSISHHTRSV